jgi:hypothetical protein
VDRAAETARQQFGALQSGVRSGQEHPRQDPPGPDVPEPACNGYVDGDGDAGGDGFADEHLVPDGDETGDGEAAMTAETARSRFGSLQAGLRAGQSARDDKEAR